MWNWSNQAAPRAFDSLLRRRGATQSLPNPEPDDDDANPRQSGGMTPPPTPDIPQTGWALPYGGGFGGGWSPHGGNTGVVPPNFGPPPDLGGGYALPSDPIGKLPPNFGQPQGGFGFPPPMLPTPPGTGGFNFQQAPQNGPPPFMPPPRENPFAPPQAPERQEGPDFTPKRYSPRRGGF